MRKIFITSTGTNIGKTFLTTLLIEELETKYKVAAVKPVVSGFRYNDQENDVYKILKTLGLKPSKKTVDSISCYRLKEPNSPDICARKTSVKIKLSKILKFIDDQEKLKPELLLIEGIGGVMVPLNETKTITDLIKKLKAENILVIGNYLGTISHTLTALEALQHNKIKVSAIVVSESISEEFIDFLELKKTLNNFTKAKLLWLPRKPDKKQKKQFINSFLSVIL